MDSLLKEKCSKFENIQKNFDFIDTTKIQFYIKKS